jgi:hypothetical protein
VEAIAPGPGHKHCHSAFSAFSTVGRPTGAAIESLMFLLFAQQCDRFFVDIDRSDALLA